MNETSFTRAQFKKEFAKLMNRISIPDNLPQEDINRMLDELHNFVQPYVPAKLFRFRKCRIDEVISFEQGTISMCVADKFSDKYDSNVYYEHHSLAKRFDLSFSPTMLLITQSLKGNPAFFPESPIRSKILYLIDLGMSDDDIVKALRKDYEVFLTKLKSEVLKLEKSSRGNKQTKIGCFTERVNSKFMWDLYAEGYKGFALEYDFRKWDAMDVELYPIIYSSKMLDATNMIDRICISKLFNIQTEEAYQKLFEAIKTQFRQLYPIDKMYYTKMYLYKDMADYSHEREWRMLKIDNDSTDQDFINISDMGTLKAIYYGMHIEPRYKAHLRAIAKSKGIKEYDVVLDKNSQKYSLKVVLLK